MDVEDVIVREKGEIGVLWDELTDEGKMEKFDGRKILTQPPNVTHERQRKNRFNVSSMNIL